jgi:excisionase family DNA binding protein
MPKFAEIAESNEKISTQAQDALRVLDKSLHNKKARFSIHEESSDKNARLPKPAVDLMVRILSELAHGNAVTVIPFKAEFTTQQAADLLNVSRPYFISLLKAGKIPFRKIGTKRRVLYSDVLSYKHREAEDAKKIIDDLAAEAQKLGIY